MKGSDILVIPSLAEGISTTILEAMAMKVPVIATNVGGNPELIQHMETGILVKPRDPKAIANAIDLLLSDKQLAKQLVDRAYQRMIREYNWDIVVEKYLKAYLLTGGCC